MMANFINIRALLAGVSQRNVFLGSALVFFLLISTASGSAATVTAGAVSEQQVKAAMLYRFLGYAEWPKSKFPDNDMPYRIWVLGAKPIATELRALTLDRKVNGRPIKIFYAKSVNQINNPHMVFIGEQANKLLPLVAEQAQLHAFLVVTENEEGLMPGSTINLRLIEGRVGFDVSLKNAHKHHLKLSARLLSVAASVEQEGR